MFEIYRPEKDATIYEYAKKVNSGIDEILELNTDSDSDQNYGASRVLIKFPEVDDSFNSFVDGGSNVFVSYGYETVNRNPAGSSTDTDPNIFNVKIEDLIEQSQNGEVNTFAFYGQRLAGKREPKNPTPEPEVDDTRNPSAWLRLWFANGMGLPKKYTIEALPVQEPWTEGRGRESDDPPTREPVNWIERTRSEDWQEEGGDFDLTPRSAEKFVGEDPDVSMDVNAVMSEDLEHGILLRRKDESFNRKTELKFFSSNTRTIYVPQLLVGRDTYTRNTEGADPVEKENFTAYVTDLKNLYSPTKTRFYVNVKEKYEQRDFLGIRPTEDRQEKSAYLPRRSLTWQIEDVRTGNVVFPFNEDYSAVSFDGSTHYFDVDLGSLFPKRQYKVLFKYTDPETGATEIFDHDQRFKVDNGSQL